MKKTSLIVVITLFVGFIVGWVIKPTASHLPKDTITSAKWYCEDMLRTMPYCKERVTILNALENLENGDINYSDNLYPADDRVNYRTVQLFAKAQESKHVFLLIPKTTPTRVVVY